MCRDLLCFGRPLIFTIPGLVFLSMYYIGSGQPGWGNTVWETRWGKIGMTTLTLLQVLSLLILLVVLDFFGLQILIR